MRRVLAVEVDGAWRNTSQVVAGGVWVEGFGRWFRLWFDYGEAPGSHMGFGRGRYEYSRVTIRSWRTNVGPGEVHGWNFRIGYWPRHCLTLLAHTRPSRRVSS